MVLFVSFPLKRMGRLIGLWGHAGVFFKEIGKIEWVGKAQFVRHFLYNEFFIGQQSLGLRYGEPVNDILGRFASVQLGLLVQLGLRGLQ